MVSKKFTLKAIAAILPFLSSTNAHMIMKTPVPYGKSTLNNSPLAADGSDFPCKLRSGVYDAEGASNVMAIGSSQTLSFTGSAVHGGGSCQVSLSTDLQPTKNSKWMVIKSIEGGCPADVAGNLPADPNGSGAATFQYTIPEGIAPGEYTIAWSWVNKIGNREFYMNCGPATITAAKKKRYAPEPKISKRQSSFPEMFVANLAGVSNGCTTPETFDISYPDPGPNVQKSPDGKFTAPIGCAGVAAQVSAGAPAAPTSAAAGGQKSSSVNNAGAASTFAAGNGASSSAAAVATSAAGNGGQATQSGGRGRQTGQPGVFATGAAQATSTATVIPIEATSAAAGAAATATSSSGNLPASSFSGDTTPGSACSTEGQWACASSGTSFQRCASGTWSQSMQMAAGTTCTPGISANINMIVTNVKRHQAMHAARKLHQIFGRSSH